MKNHAATAIADQWTLLEAHFCHHADLMKRFRDANPSAVIRMWKNRTDEAGESLSQFESEALVERYCELFGSWPE